MTAKEYADIRFRNYPTYNKIAREAFEAGMENAKPTNVKKLEKELNDVKAELKSLWQTLEDPEECGKLLSGL